MPRSWLYVPADSLRKVDKGLASGAGAVLLDLEDGVGPAAKQAARDNLGESARGWADAAPQVWVRVSQEALQADVEAAVRPGLSGLCLAKAESPAQLTWLAQELEQLERARGLAPGSVALMPLVETAVGVLAVQALSAAPRVRVLQLGEQDLRADLSLPPEAGGAELPYPLVHARSAVVLASAAAGLLGPVAPVSIDIAGSGLLEETRRLRDSGFGSRAVIHPMQLEPVHAAFLPSADEVRSAREIVAAAEAAQGGAARDGQGRMVDEPVLRQARAVLRAAAEH